MKNFIGLYESKDEEGNVKEASYKGYHRVEMPTDFWGFFSHWKVKRKGIINRKPIYFGECTEDVSAIRIKGIFLIREDNQVILTKKIRPSLIVKQYIEPAFLAGHLVLRIK